MVLVTMVLSYTNEGYKDAFMKFDEHRGLRATFVNLQMNTKSL